MKRIFSLLLGVLMVATLFAGCGKGKADPNEKVTLIWNVGWSEQEDTEKVMEVFNKKLQALLPNTTVKYVEYDASAFALKMAAKETVDIAWTGYSHDLSTEIANGYFLELDDLIKEYAPEIQAERKKFAASYDSATVNGELYALPIQQPIVHQTGFLKIPAQYNQYFDGDAFLTELHNNYFTTEKVYQIIDDYFQKLIANNLMDNIGFYTRDIFYNLATRGYDFVEANQDGGWFVYDAHAEDPKIISFNETEQAKMFFEYAAKWYKEGIIPADILTATDTAPADAVVIALSSSSESWFKVDDEKGIRYVRNDDGEITHYTYLLDDEDNLFNGTSILGSELTYTGIPFTSEHPERAMQLLNLLRSNTKESNELLNLLVYGFEENSEEAKELGRYHYTLEEKEDGDHIAHGNGYTAQATQSNAYGVPHWKITNVFLPYRTPNILDGQKEWAEEYLTETVPNELYQTKLQGFKPNLVSDYAYELSQLSQVVAEYQEILYDGVMGDKWEDSYNEMMNKMQAAGLDKLLKIVNEKAQEFMK